MTDTNRIQDLIDAKHAEGGGVVRLDPGEYRVNLTIPDSVTLDGGQGVYGYGPRRRGSTRLVGATDGWVVDVTGSNAGVTGFDIYGGNAHGGLRSAGTWCDYTSLHFNLFPGPALQLAGGNATTVDKVLAINSCLDRATSQDVGVIEVAGFDHYISRVEASASLSGGVTSTGLHVNAWVIRSTNTFITNCVGEFADRGYLILGAKNRSVGIRADRNMGIGYETRGGANLFAACSSIDNSHGANDAYPSFLTTGFGNNYVGCDSTYNAGVLPTYAFEDTVQNTDPGNRNTYTGCTGKGVRGKYSGRDWLGSSFDAPNHPVRVGKGNPTTIPVDESGFLVLAEYTEPTTVTDFTGGHSGQTITVWGNSRVTIPHGGNFITQSESPLMLKTNRPYRFTKYNGVWSQG